MWVFQAFKALRKMMLPKMSFLDSFDEFDGGVYEVSNVVSTYLWKTNLRSFDSTQMANLKMEKKIFQRFLLSVNQQVLMLRYSSAWLREAKKWDPDLGFLNSAKGAVIWPPGYLHETSTLPPPEAGPRSFEGKLSFFSFCDLFMSSWKAMNDLWPGKSSYTNTELLRIHRPNDLGVADTNRLLRRLRRSTVMSKSENSGRSLWLCAHSSICLSPTSAIFETQRQYIPYFFLFKSDHGMPASLFIHHNMCFLKFQTFRGSLFVEAGFLATSFHVCRSRTLRGDDLVWLCQDVCAGHSAYSKRGQDERTAAENSQLGRHQSGLTLNVQAFFLHLFLLFLDMQLSNWLWIWLAILGIFSQWLRGVSSTSPSSIGSIPPLIFTTGGWGDHSGGNEDLVREQRFSRTS